MAYATTQDIIDRLGEGATLRVADDGTGQVEVGRLQQAVTEAEGEVNSYLMLRYSVPVSPVPAMVKNVTLDLAVYRLFLWRGYDQEEDVEVRTARNDAIAWLDKVARGIVSLGTATPAKDFGARMDGADRVFSRDKMRDF